MSAICDVVGVELLYNSVLRKSNQLETRCGRESQHPAEGALRPPINQFGDQTSWRRCGRENQHQAEWALKPPINQLGDQTSWREDAGMRTCHREAGLPGPRLSSPAERERIAFHIALIPLGKV